MTRIAYRAAKRAAGLCRDCLEPAVLDARGRRRVRCAKHVHANRVQTAKWKENRMAKEVEQCIPDAH